MLSDGPPPKRRKRSSTAIRIPQTLSLPEFRSTVSALLLAPVQQLLSLDSRLLERRLRKICASDLQQLCADVAEKLPTTEAHSPTLVLKEDRVQYLSRLFRLGEGALSWDFSPPLNPNRGLGIMLLGKLWFPSDLLGVVSHYLGFSRKNLCTWGMVCAVIHEVFLTEWSRTHLVVITKSNLRKIPISVLSGCLRIRLFYAKSFVLRELKYLWDTVKIGRIERILLTGSRSWSHFHLRDLRNLFVSMVRKVEECRADADEEGDEMQGVNSGDGFASLRRFSFPRHLSGKADKDFPGIEEFSLQYIAPSLSEVICPVSLNWIRDLVDQIRKLQLTSPVDVDLLSRCPKLVSLDLGSNSIPRGPGFSVIASKLPNLRNLAVGFDFAAVVFVEDLVLPRLKRLRLSGIYPGTSLRALSVSFPKLQILELNSPTVEEAYGFSSRHMPKLRLDLAMGERVGQLGELPMLFGRVLEGRLKTFDGRIECSFLRHGAVARIKVSSVMDEIAFAALKCLVAPPFVRLVVLETWCSECPFISSGETFDLTNPRGDRIVRLIRCIAGFSLTEFVMEGTAGIFRFRR